MSSTVAGNAEPVSRVVVVGSTDEVDVDEDELEDEDVLEEAFDGTVACIVVEGSASSPPPHPGTTSSNTPIAIASTRSRESIVETYSLIFGGVRGVPYRRIPPSHHCEFQPVTRTHRIRLPAKPCRRVVLERSGV